MFLVLCKNGENIEQKRKKNLSFENQLGIEAFCNAIWKIAARDIKQAVFFSRFTNFSPIIKFKADRHASVAKVQEIVIVRLFVIGFIVLVTVINFSFVLLIVNYHNRLNYIVLDIFYIDNKLKKVPS